MTAIVGVAHNGRVWIGGDSAGVSGWTIRTRADSKVFVKAGVAFGIAGSFRGGQLLRSSLVLPERADEVELFDYMVTVFVDAVRECFKAGGHAIKTNEEESTETVFLVGIEGRLFSIHIDYQVAETVDGYDAMGCGRELAYGSLHTSTALKMTPKARVRAALKAASYGNGGVCPPFAIVSTLP